MEKFDAIVVGAGPAGSTAAAYLAQGGASALLIERGPKAGSKNVSGALVYARVLARHFPEFWEKAPVERRVRGHGLVFLSNGSAVQLEARQFDEPVDTPNAFTVHRASFDQWLVNQAEAAGVTVITGYTVDELLVEGSRVTGIRCGPDELHADVVINAEGAKSLLLEQAGLRDRWRPSDLALGIKEIVELPAEEIESRFNLEPGEGAAFTMVGGTNGLEAGGFVYTNRDSLSLGLVVRLDSLAQGEQQPHELLEAYRQHPYIARLTQGGRIREYSAAIVHEGSMDQMPPRYADGLLVAGSAAGLLVNNLFTFRGIDLAVESGALAAEAFLEAKQAGDFSAGQLASYEQRLNESFVIKDMRTFQDAYRLVANQRMVKEYPELAGLLIEDLFIVDPEPSKPLRSKMLSRIQEKVGLVDLGLDLWAMWRAL